jgi:hypothetical protein
MSYGEQPYYWAVCDRCGYRAEYDEYAAWSGKDQVDEYADDAGWYVEDGHHVCDDCTPHGPDWDDEHEACAKGRAELECEGCRPYRNSLTT